MNSLKQKVYDNLLADILDGIYPLDFVFNEKYLIDKYHVSRSPVRDALIELCSEDVLYVMPRFGYKIVPISEKEVRDLTEFRLLLEVSAFEKVCEKYCEQIEVQLRNYISKGLAEINRPIPNLLTIWNNNIDFHVMLISWLGNRYAEEALRTALMKQFRAYSQMYWTKNDRIGDHQTFTMEIDKHHLRLSECMARRDFEQAVQVLKDDICEIPSYIRSE